MDPAGLIVPTQPLPPIIPNESIVSWPNGRVSFTIKVKGRSYLEVQGLMAPHSYSRHLQDGNPVHQVDVRKTIVNEVNESLTALEKSVGEEFLQKQVIGETGFYSMWIPYSQDLWSRLQNTKDLPTTLTMEAVTTDPGELSKIKELSKNINKIIASAASKDNTDGFSGLTRIGVTNQFLQGLEQELGEKADGSLVNVGITDTGITYNHPAFLDGNGKSRIAYMQDTTLEGKVYFPETAHFSVRLGTAAEAANFGTKEANLIFAEDVSAHLSPSADLPLADGANLLTLPKGTPLKVPAAIRQAVVDGATVKLGLLAEITYNSAEGSFDLNHDGNTNDVFGLFLVAPQDSGDQATYQVFVALNPIGTLGKDKVNTFASAIDLSNAMPLRDFNSSHDTTQVFAERFGIALGTATLKTTEKDLDVKSITASVVGYDSGNHGTHVAGIVGGRKTISNDKDSTLARGVAPNTRIFSNRVCSNTRGCSASRGIQELALDAKVDVINMSLGGDSAQNDGYDTQSLLIDRLTQITNTLFVLSAGNSGPGLQTVGSPGTSRLALTVGASASAYMMGRQSHLGVPTSAAPDEDFMMYFSSRGPLNNGGFKPDVTAPGTELSAVGLNQPGRSGTDVFQGTSMAAPTVTGAFALLLDSARRYNRKHPDSKIPTDVYSLRKVLVGSAKAFDVTTFDPKTKATRNGEYTWIDQGTGIIDVPAAWLALKKLGSTPVSTGITGKGQTIPTVYEVRTSVTGRDGTVYNGAPPADPHEVTTYGAGLWIDTTSKKNIYVAGIARRLPLAAEGMQTQNQQGDAFANLVSSGEFFKLTTEIHGSNVEWIKANTFFGAESASANRCDTIQSNELLTLVGQGALDSQGGPSGTAESTIYFCVDRAKIADLPKGDHGALIRAYKTSADGTVTEPVPAFIIPVYLNVPHETLTGGSQYTVTNGEVTALGVKRNYIDVPTDINSLKVSLSVPKATVDAAGQAQNCSSVSLSVYGGSNVALPPSLNAGHAASCTGPGFTMGPQEEDYGHFEAEVLSPKAGLWDLHVIGGSRVPLSHYQLRVDYAKSVSQLTSITGELAALNGHTNIEIKEVSRASVVSPEHSTYIVDKALGRSSFLIKDGEKLDVPSKKGQVLRTFPADVLNVDLSSSGAPGSDIDIELFECDGNGANCLSLAVSASPTDEETVSFKPSADKAYKLVADGYAIKDGQATIQIAETIGFTAGAKGTVAASMLGSDRFWSITYTLDANDPFFKKDIFRGDQSYEILGSLRVASPDLTLIVVPVQIKLN